MPELDRAVLETFHFDIEHTPIYEEGVHLSPDPTWVYDVESNNFLDVNEAAIRQYGFTHDEFMSMKIHQLEPEEELVVEALTLLAGWSEFEKAHRKEIYRHQKERRGDLCREPNQ